MNVVVKIKETFPTGEVLAVARVIIESSLIINDVKLMIDRYTQRYYIEFPKTAELDKPLIKLCNKDLSHKFFDALTFQYEKYIDAKYKELESPGKDSDYIIQLEKERIEAKRKKQRRRLIS